MNKPTRSIVIIGGGTAGWITAGVLAAKHSPSGISVTLIESPDIKPVGVGEGTWPTMRTTLRRIGISETDFIRQCDVAFKQGAKFIGWSTGAAADFYYHPLVLPAGFSQGNLAPYWQKHQQNLECSFSRAVCYQEALCEQNLAPKQISTPEYDALANYAYHLNAGKFSEFLKNHCIDKLGVRYISDTVTHVNNAENGDLLSVATSQEGLIQGDLFVDCTGFHGLLIDKHYRVPFIDCSDVLMVDRALAAQVPYAPDDDAIVSHTLATAQPAGWIWDIGLQSRRGVGHVYSSRHMSQEQAEEALVRYLQPSIGQAAAENLPVRQIPIKAGHRSVFWQNNCVAIGLSAGFLEPLEASALVMVELSAEMLADQMPSCRASMDFIAKRFNDRFRYRWDRVIDFLKLHYALTRRTEPFWRDNTADETIPDSLRELLALWQYQYPWDQDFSDRREVFPAASYQYVLYGMGFRTGAVADQSTPCDESFGQQKFAENQRAVNHLLKTLPKHRDLINKIHQYGLQRI